ncbi:MAG: phosphoribosylglycinamide synthetase C domain-containing protein, partial [Syntrophales bacterium]|nr:phosphoribosylglycinamide synthetase C domain-containing protein [Syntrophales bacterium]
AIINGALDKLKIEFERKATVCKSIVTKGYGLPDRHPDAASLTSKIEIGNVGAARLYYSSVDRRKDGLYMTTSRAIGVVGIADRLAEAEKIAESAAAAVKGPVDHRPDIGTEAVVKKRVQHMQDIRGR